MDEKKRDTQTVHRTRPRSPGEYTLALLRGRRFAVAGKSMNGYGH